MTKRIPKKAYRAAVERKRPRAPRKGSRQGFQNLPIAEQVRAAAPLAQQLIAEGIDYGTRIDDMFADRVAELLDDNALNAFVRDASEDALSTWCDRLEAARAIGIALGLLLRPEAFSGGAR